MVTRTKTCPECSQEFSYEIGKGKDRKHCSAPCRQKLKKRNREAREGTLEPCCIEGCQGRATRKGKHCEKHYNRIRRTGVAAPRQTNGRYLTSVGYVKVLNRAHPLADAAGTIYEHRQVAFAQHEGQCPDCFWCARALHWHEAVVDHLDEQKDNNEPSNLVVSCNPCNRARGSMLPFIKRMTDVAFNVFIERLVLHKYP